MTFHIAEIATILAALQLYRESGYGDPSMYRWLVPRINGIATWSHKIEALQNDEIDKLIEKFCFEAEKLA